MILVLIKASGSTMAFGLRGSSWLTLGEMGVPAGTEFLDVMTPPYLLI